MDIFLGLVLLITACLTIYAAIMLYLLPAHIANRRGHKEQLAIFIVNLFLGWSLIGWVGCLAWALAYGGPLPSSADGGAALHTAKMANDSKACPRCAESIKAAAHAWSLSVLRQRNLAGQLYATSERTRHSHGGPNPGRRVG
jgi:hypothetical protein